MFLFQNKGVCGFFGFYKFADNYFILRYDIFIPVITKKRSRHTDKRVDVNNCERTPFRA